MKSEENLFTSNLPNVSVDSLEYPNEEEHNPDCLAKPSRCSCADLNFVIWACYPGKGLTEHLALTGGKWMLFLSPKEIDSVWSKVKELLASGKLGSAVKVRKQSDRKKGLHYLICVYTGLAENVVDIFRVLVVLHQNGLASEKIRYKTDQATEKGIHTTSSAKYDEKKWSYRNQPIGFRVSKFESFVEVKENRITVKMLQNNIGEECEQGVIAEITYCSKVATNKNSSSSKADEGGDELKATIYDPPVIISQSKGVYNRTTTHPWRRRF